MEIESIQDKLDTVKIKMNENIQFALKNTDKIEDIQQKSELLSESSNTFREKSNNLKSKMCSKYWKQNIMISFIILLVIIIIILAVQK